MTSRKHAILSLLSLIAAASNVGWAKSVYVINDTNARTLQAYKIEGANLTWQTGYTCYSQVSGGAVGVALDESEYGPFLFVTFEDDNKIELVNAKSMQYVDTVMAPEAGDLAGVVVDIGKRKVYVIDRGEKNLYIYSWDAGTMELTLDFPDPYYVELQDCFEGYGLALDEGNGRLYVGDNTAIVKYYDTSTWSKLGEFGISHKAIGIALDVENQFVYTGSAWMGGDTDLSQYNLIGATEETVDVGSPVLGIAVDEDTSLVYLTTYGSGLSPDRLMIYNSALVKQPWESGAIGNPAGVCVPKGNVLYKPPFPSLTLVKDDNDVNCVYPYNFIDENYLVYHISYDANGYSGGGGVITDHLPFEVDYHSSDPCGVYDPCLHTVSWDIGGISPSDSNTFEIITEVACSARPGSTIHNICEIENDEYYSVAVVDTNVCCYGGNIIYVDKDANGCNNGTSWDDAYTVLQDAFDQAGSCGGIIDIWVAEGIYKPVWRTDASGAYKDYSFDLIEDVGLFGHSRVTSRAQASVISPMPTMRQFSMVKSVRITMRRSSIS